MDRKNRIEWIDYAKGLAIILVVYGHSFRGLRDASYVKPESLLASVDYFIYCFHMPLFFLLSGMLAGGTGALFDRHFWAARLGRILWPYVLWMTVELILLSAFSTITTMGPIKLGLHTYLFAPISPFWFLYALLFCHVFVHLLSRLGSTNLFMTALVAFGLGQSSYMSELVHLITWGLMWFVAGNVSATTMKTPEFATRLSRFSSLFCLAAATSGFGLLFQSWDIPYRLNIPAAMTGGGTVLCLAQQLSRVSLSYPAVRAIQFLGLASLTILVTHILATAAARIILTRVFAVHNICLLLSAAVVAGIIFPVLVQVVFARLGILWLAGLPQIDFKWAREQPVTMT